MIASGAVDTPELSLKGRPEGRLFFSSAQIYSWMWYYRAH